MHLLRCFEVHDTFSRLNGARQGWGDRMCWPKRNASLSRRSAFEQTGNPHLSWCAVVWVIIDSISSVRSQESIFLFVISHDGFMLRPQLNPPARTRIISCTKESGLSGRWHLPWGREDWWAQHLDIRPTRLCSTVSGTPGTKCMGVIYSAFSPNMMAL